MALKDMTPFNERPIEELRAISRKGGINSGIAKRRNKTVQQVAEMVLNLKAPMPAASRKALAKHWKVKEQDIDVMFTSLTALAKKAMKGDAKAFEVVRDSAGQKPREQMAMSHEFAGDAVLMIGYEEEAPNGD